MSKWIIDKSWSSKTKDVWRGGVHFVKVEKPEKVPEKDDEEEED